MSGSCRRQGRACSGRRGIVAALRGAFPVAIPVPLLVSIPLFVSVPILMLGLLLAAVAIPAHAQIYKWTDENGIVHYSSERPPSGNDFESFRFPCYASDPGCGARINWERVPLNRSAFPDIIREVASLHQVEEGLIRAIIHAESAYQPDAKSPKGAQGLMQLMPGTQADLGVSDPYDPVENIEGGTRYLAQLLARFDGDVTLASAAYNAGPGAVERHGGVPPYTETREYVRRIGILHRRYAGERQ